MRTQKEIEAELNALGWSLEGPTRTPRGWKATIQHSDPKICFSESTSSPIEELLESLLRSARTHENKPQRQP
jgi:hypothetical protein